jgi:Na+/H+ antiporter NhaC
MEITLSAASLIPSLLAIILALVTRQVFISMFVAIWAGAFIIEGASPANIIPSLFQVVDTWILEAVVPNDGDNQHFSIILFSLLTGGMIGVLSHNGGMQGVLHYFSKFANTRQKGQWATFGLGGLIFFDDYANTLIVGNTMRPLTDSLKISREKLAFIVDSTAAPIACIAVISTWVGFQASLIDDSLEALSADGVILTASGFELIMGAIPYSFYPLLMIIFMAIMIITKRDYGAMYKAEYDALHTPIIQPKPTQQESEFVVTASAPRAANAVLPIICYIIGTIWGLFETGTGSTIKEILGSSDPFQAVLWGALAGLLVAIIMSIATKALSLTKTIEAMEVGLQPMIIAMVILCLAWAIADINTQLKTADYIVSFLGDSIAAMWLPVLIFIIAAITSFATGSSWSTMGILVPLILPLTINTLIAENIDATMIAAHPLLLASIASVLTGAVWGDHCSPISDTTILSSMASHCDHVQHVRTQMPYAVTVAAVSILCGLVPIVFGAPFWLGLILGTCAIYAVFRVLGKQL